MVGVSKYTLVFTLLIVVCVFFLTADGKKHFDEGDDPVKISLFIMLVVFALRSLESTLVSCKLLTFSDVGR